MNYLLDDLLLVGLALVLYVLIQLNSAITSLLVILCLLVAEIVVRLGIDATYLLLRQIHKRAFSLVDSKGKISFGVSLMVSIGIIVSTLIGVAILIAFLVIFIRLEISEFRELGFYLYSKLETLLKHSQIWNYFSLNGESLLSTVREFSKDYGEDLNEQLSIPLNLTALINGTNVEVRNELLSGLNNLINNTFAINTTEYNNFIKETYTGNSSIFDIISFIHTNFSKIFT